MGKRRAARELALRTLFQVDVGGMKSEEAIDLAFAQEPRDAQTLAFARDLVEGVVNQRARIDAVIEKYARDWTLERMANIDRNVLRLAICELLFMPDIPPSVTVDEAVELAKKYSTAESGRFVNGILGNLVRHLDDELAEQPVE
ncbi:MAG: transcription antitermination factor NusB [Proteobacteria bacterium]|nr:transcription antitermination factor NusB [Pseudomonadota bacterium]